jgi:hypothetical protein
MFISSSSVQGSLWGWTNKELPIISPAPASTNVNIGTFSGLTLAPNGWSYAIPTNAGPSDNTQTVLIVKPGSGNGKLFNYSAGTYTQIVADNSSGKPFFSAGQSFANKGILAPNGKIYFFPFSNSSSTYCEFDPGDNTGTNCSWVFRTLPANIFSLGAVLGKDGKIYIIPGSPSIALIRLDVSGASPSVEYSFYDGTEVNTSDIVTVQPSTGLSANQVKVSSVASLSVGMLVKTVTIVSGESNPGTYNIVGDSTGVLSPNGDTTIINIDVPNKILTLSLVPSIPMANNSRLLCRAVNKKLANTTSQINRRWYNFLNRSYNSTTTAALADWSTDGQDIKYQLSRHPQQNLAGYASNASAITFSGFLDTNSNKIYILPGAGNQIFWIDPNNWSNKDAINTSAGLSLTNVNIASGTPNYNTVKANSYKKFAGAPVPGVNGKFYLPIFASSTTPSEFIGDTLRYVVELDTATNMLTPLTPLTFPSTPASNLYDTTATGLLPNGFQFAVNAVNATAANRYRNNIQIDTNNSAGSVKLNGSNFFNKSTMSANITNTGWTAGAAYVQGGFITFPTTSQSIGKVLLSGKNTIYGIEYLSVKGFYTGVSKFDLMDSDYLDIPTDLADLPTSGYNTHKNTLV